MSFQSRIIGLFAFFFYLNSIYCYNPTKLVNGKITTDISLFKYKYYYVDESQSTNPYVRVKISACTGRVSIYVRECGPNNITCAQIPPSPKNYDYLRNYTHEVGQPTYDSICNENKDGLCSSVFMYFIAIYSQDETASKSPAQVEIDFHNWGNDFPFRLVDGISKSIFVDQKNKRISWKPAVFCKYPCTKQLHDGDAKYSIFENKALTGTNLGTVCGMKKNGRSYIASTKTYLSFDQVKLKNVPLAFNVEVYSEKYGTFTYHATSFEVRPSGSNVFPSSSEGGGMGAGWVMLIILFIICGGAGAGAAVWFVMKKRQETKFYQQIE